MQGSYDPGLVALSFLVAFAASWSGVGLARRVVAAEGREERWWLVGGAFAFGSGIWTMHFIGMLAYDMPVPVSYDIPITALSLVIAVVASGFGLHVASRQGTGQLGRAGCALLIGGAIAGMHYTGMAAMRMPAEMVYHPMVLAASVVVAIVVARVAIWLLILLGHSREPMPYRRVGAAVLMGIAICGMHYTGMAATSYRPWPSVAAVELENDIVAGVLLGIAILAILMTIQLASWFADRLVVERAQHAMSKLRADHLLRMLDESTNEIYVFDAESLRYVEVNGTACRNLGYTRDDLRAMTPADVTHLDLEELRSELAPLFRGTKDDLLIDVEHHARTGKTYQCQMHVQVSRATGPPMLLATVTDVSERRRLEMELAHARKMESIGQLAAGIAHEINTPAQFVGDNMTFIKEAFEKSRSLHTRFMQLYYAARDGHAADGIVRDLGTALEELEADFLMTEIPLAVDQSLDGVGQISKIVQAMKEFSHPGNEHTEPTDLNLSVSNTVTVASNEWKYVAEIETDLEPGLPPIMCRAQDINQVILNLIVNAAQAIAEKLGETPTEKGRIRIATGRKGEYAQIAVSDTGCGIPADNVQRIFEPFFTTKDVGKGTGQGLAMAYRSVVEQHGGRLDVQSSPGSGTTFLICLPIEPIKAGSDPAGEIAA